MAGLGAVTKSAAGPTVIIGLLTGMIYLVIIGIASYFSHELTEGNQLYGNRSTPQLLFWSLPGALIGFAAIFEACRYLLFLPVARQSALALNTLAFFFLLLPFGWAAQVVHDKGESRKWKTLASFCIAAPWFELATLLMMGTEKVARAVASGYRHEEEMPLAAAKESEVAAPVGSEVPVSTGGPAAGTEVKAGAEQV